MLFRSAAVVTMAVREWLRLLRGSRPPDSSETPPVWLPPEPATSTALAPAGALAIGLAFARHVSDQHAIDVATARSMAGPADPCAPRILIDVPEVRDAVADSARARAYVNAAERRFNGNPRCC